MSPNLCVKRLFLEWGERGEGGGRRGGGRDRERRGIWGEKGDREKRGGRKVRRGGRKVGGRGAKMGRGEWRGGTEETENRMGADMYGIYSVLLAVCIPSLGTCEVLKQQQSEEGEGDYCTFKASFYTEDSQKMNNTYQTTSQWLTTCDCAIAMLHIYYKILLYHVFDAYSTSCDINYAMSTVCQIFVQRAFHSKFSENE